MSRDESLICDGFNKISCEGRLTDLVDRMRRFKSYRGALGRQRTLMIWGVPQAFNDSNYWSRYPTRQELLTSCAIYVIEGAVGLMAWYEAPGITDVCIVISDMLINSVRAGVHDIAFYITAIPHGRLLVLVC